MIPSNIKSQIEKEIKEMESNYIEGTFYRTESTEERIAELKAKLEGIKIGEQKAQALWDKVSIAFEDISDVNPLLYRVIEIRLEKIKKEFELK